MMAKPIELMIVGAQKAGTSSLVRYLGEHPKVCTHDTREMTYFVRDEEYAGGYEGVFERYFGRLRDESTIIVAKSAGMMHWPEAIGRLHAHSPNMHVLALLRQPVDRAYSAYWYCRRVGLEDLRSFEEAIEAEPRRMREDPARWRHCAYVERGEYHRQLLSIYEIFDKSRVHVFFLEDLKRDPAELCERIFRLLGLDPDFTPDVNRKFNKAAMVRSETVAKLLSENLPLKKLADMIISRRARYWIRERVRRFNEKEFTPPAMNPETRRKLIGHFEPLNRKLADLTGRDLKGWNY